MGWLDNLFGREEKTKAPSVAETGGKPFAGLESIRFGRYSDNNRSFQKTQSWYQAESHFKAKAYSESFAALFDFITDDAEGNVIFRPDGDKFSFEILQGSKKVYGQCDGEHIVARASIAVMEQPSNAVMRRLLELNFSLFYSRCALDDANTLCMIFDTSVATASPNKLYYGLREIARYADRQDDLLVADFATLKATDIDHIQPLPAGEAEVKYRYFRKWIEETLALTNGLNPDSFSGAIAYAYLTLLYRIDFLIIPEAKLLADLEEVTSFYWTKKDETPIVERNAMLRKGIMKLLDISLDQFREGVYRSKGTFSIMPIPSMDKVKENVQSANKDAQWNVDNKHPELALVANEYGMVYNQFSYSVPALITELTTIYMAVLHAGFFKELGMKTPFYNTETKTLNKEQITRAIDDAIARWPDKYVSLKWDHGRIKYDGLWEFCQSFSEQVVSLNLEVKR